MMISKGRISQNNERNKASEVSLERSGCLLSADKISADFDLDRPLRLELHYQRVNTSLWCTKSKNESKRNSETKFVHSIDKKHYKKN